MEKYVYLFDEIDAAQKACDGDWEAARGLLGGKGANLGDMTRLGVPVPPGFTVTTEACNAYLAAGGEFPEGMWEQEREAVAALEKATGKRFGSADDPLLLSCRSGAKFSMPGMMDTVLNLGMNEEVVAGIARRSGDERFAWDLYRRLLQMFSGVVLGVRDEVFEEVITAQRSVAGVKVDADLTAADWRSVARRFLEIVRIETGHDFPTDPWEQLSQATEAVFRSWNGKRAVDYRNAAGIAHDLGTAVNIQTMVFGNLGDTSGTGVCMSRNATDGTPELEGDFLINAQGEDVVAGIRATLPIEELNKKMPSIWEELLGISQSLEKHYREMQDMEFTIEEGKLWLLQTRNGKRTAQAAVRIAVDMVKEGLIDKPEAVHRIEPDHVDFFMHPQFDAEALRAQQPLARGLNVSPGAAVGLVALDPDVAEHWARDEGKKVILVRPETKPDDVHGMLAAEGVLTSRGGRTSHAALVARQFGKPAVVGVADMEINLDGRFLKVGSRLIHEGEPMSIDGNTGAVYDVEVPTVVPDINNPYLIKILEWADELRRLGVRANADYGRDAERARAYGAEGIGLCRTEHMFFEEERLPIVQKMIMARTKPQQEAAIDALLPMQRGDFEALFRAMDGLPVIIRLLDPPLHEFLPSHQDLQQELADLKLRLPHQHTLAEIDDVLAQIRAKQDILARVEDLQEANPMLGTRGVRLGILIPALYRMQVRAIFEAAVICAKDGGNPVPEVMIPLVSHAAELRDLVGPLREMAETVLQHAGIEIPYLIGTMIEIPRAALTASEIAETAEFFSFGTNDLTQTVFGISRDDAETGFLMYYQQKGLLPNNPFATIDPDGVGRIMEIAVNDGRATREDLEVGVCGEHGGDPESIRLCHRIGLDYVSCSPFRVPIARLAAAHAAIEAGD